MVQTKRKRELSNNNNDTNENWDNCLPDSVKTSLTTRDIKS